MQNNDDENLLICRMARLIYKVPHLISWVNDIANHGHFADLKVKTVNPAYSTLFFIENIAMNPEYPSKDLNIEAHSKIQEVKVKSAAFAGAKLSRLNMPTELSIMTVNRKGVLMVPDEQTVVQMNDILTLMGKPDEVEKISLIIQQKK